jgi:hypothetical protein
MILEACSNRTALLRPMDVSGTVCANSGRALRRATGSDVRADRAATAALCAKVSRAGLS